ncbi:MAG: transposase [Acidobacteria bacterium]|nr:transposase [Acidobacteriota bacterium]
MGESVADIDVLSVDDLKKLVVEVFEANAALRAEIAMLRDEIARLKGLKGRPKLRPSGMEPASEPKPPRRRRGKRRAKGGKTARLTIHEEQVLKAEVPPGSRFKGYETYVVRDLLVRPRVIRFRRERWRTPDGRTVLAPLPGWVNGHFGPELRRYVLAQYHQGQVTIPRLVTQLNDIGIEISKRQVVRLLNDGNAGFRGEAIGVLRAGLASAAWISVDDTGARHQGRNAYCTQIGNQHFTWFATTRSKSRLNFLELLRAGHDDYVVNDDALAYMRRRNLSQAVIDLLANHQAKRFTDAGQWRAHLAALGIDQLKVHPDPLRIATEGALYGSVTAHQFLRDAVILSDDAGQFNVGHHALCWVHAERLIHKLVGFNDEQRQAIERIRALIWWFYADLKAYQRAPTALAKAALKARFERIFNQRTGYATLDRALARLHANKAELLVVLDRPEIPLHTNGSENDIRCQVTRRKISGGTRSDVGRDCRDAFLSLMKTSGKLGVSFWDYLGNRLAVPEAPSVPFLPDLIRQRAQPP